MNFSPAAHPAPGAVGRAEKGLRRARWLELGILGFPLLLTGAVLCWEKQNLRGERAAALEWARNVLSGTVHHGRAMAMATRSALQTFDRVDARSWSNYIENLNLDPDGPFNLGYASVISDEELRRRRVDGPRPEAIHPPGRRDLYAPILFFTPFLKTSSPLTGFDGWAHPERRRAMERARDTGGLAATPPLPLQGGADGGPSVGVVFYAAVYRPGPIPPTPAERRAALRGFVIVALAGERMHKLLESAPGQGLFSLFDPGAPAVKQWLFGSMSAGSTSDFSALVEAGDRRWRLTLSPHAKPFTGLTTTALVVLVGGAVLTAALGAFLIISKRAYREALQRSKSLALEMRQSVLFLDSVLHEMPVVVYVKDVEKLRFVHRWRASR